MSFGLSPDPVKSKMVGGDPVVAWVDKETLQGYAIDYFLDAKSQCSGQRGSCPDTRIQVNIYIYIKYITEYIKERSRDIIQLSLSLIHFLCKTGVKDEEKKISSEVKGESER